MPLQEAMTVLDPDTMQPVPWDGETMGEIMFRGNITMKGYLKNLPATDKAFAGGWFHTGDLAVMQPDGYVKIRDRSKDIIISGGENISSLEVEEALYRHPAVLSAAVVAQPDEKWGETPCAFIELKPGATVTGRCPARVLPRAPGALQGAQDLRVPGTAEDLDRQDPEIRAARHREVDARDRVVGAAAVDRRGHPGSHRSVVLPAIAGVRTRRHQRNCCGELQASRAERRPTCR